jgi:hypothetical protein
LKMHFQCLKRKPCLCSILQSVSLARWKPETHTKRQASLHGCLHSLLGDRDKGIEIVYGEEKIYFVLGRLEQQRQNKNLVYRHGKPKPRKDAFHLYSLRSHSPQFQQSAGATLLCSLSGGNTHLHPCKSYTSRSLIRPVVSHINKCKIVFFAKLVNKVYTAYKGTVQCELYHV